MVEEPHLPYYLYIGVIPTILSTLSFLKSISVILECKQPRPRFEY